MLEVSIGHASSAGPKPKNEDFAAWVSPEGDDLLAKGILAAVADGVSACDDGALASRLVVRGLMADYYATPDTWEPVLAAQRVIQALNRWLIAQASRQGQTLVTTLSAIVLRGLRYSLAHVGDSRIYLLRRGHLQRLTRDHVWEQAGMQHVLTRAIGLDPALAVDYHEDTLEAQDVFLLVSDGVWEPLGDRRLHELLHLHLDPQRAAEAIVEAALREGTRDNATALVLRVDGLPHEALSDRLAAASDWPVPPKLKPGQIVDRFIVEQVLHESRGSLLYRVRQEGSGQVWVLKTLNPLLANDTDARAALLTEEWLAKRLVDAAFPQVLPLSVQERHWLYYVMSWHEGHTLQDRIDVGYRFSVPEAIEIGRELAKALAIMHRLNILHRDIKPDNIHRGSDGHLRILDLGVATCEHQNATSTAIPGTPSFMAPELFDGQAPSWASDVYAAGATLYHILTGHYPYGEIEPFQTPKFGDPVPPSRYRPDIPLWFEQWLLKAVARDAGQRLTTADEMLVGLEKGDLDRVRVRVRSPLAERDPTMLWMLIAIGSLSLNLLCLYLLLVTG